MAYRRFGAGFFAPGTSVQRSGANCGTALSNPLPRVNNDALHEFY